MLAVLSCILLPQMVVAMKKPVPAPKYTQAQLDQALQTTSNDFARAIEYIRLGADPACYQTYDDDWSSGYGRKANPQKSLQSLLFAVARQGTKEQLDVLLGKGAVLTLKDREGRNLAHVAAMAGNSAVLDVLIISMSVCGKSESGAEALHYAAQAGKLDAVQLLLGRNASIEATDSNGAGVLHYAAAGGSELVIKKLLDAKASIDAINRDGAGVMHVAAEHAQLHLVRPLLAAKACITATDLKGAGVLHYAVRHTKTKGGVQSIIRLLLAEKAAVDSLDFEGQTPLHDAVTLNNSAAALALMDEGADTTIKDKQGKIPLRRMLEAQNIAKPTEKDECKGSM